MPEEIKRARAKRSKIHGTGLFATEDVAKGDKIIEYTGERITKTEAVRRYEKQSAEGAIYLFDLNKRHDIDGAVGGNEAKYANHSCEPNAETIIERGRIWVQAKRPIKKGEEILYDYNFPLFDHEKRPCRCGSPKCRQWIISKSAYYYKRRKETKKAEGAVPSKRPNKKADTRRPATTKTREAAKKPARKGAKKTASEGAKKPASKGAKRPAPKATKKPAPKATKKSAPQDAKKATRKAARRVRSPTQRVDPSEPPRIDTGARTNGQRPPRRVPVGPQVARRVPARTAPPLSAQPQDPAPERLPGLVVPATGRPSRKAHQG